MKKNGNHEAPAIDVDASAVTEGTFQWVNMALRGEVTEEAREVFRRQQAIPVDACPFCDSPFVAHIESAKGRRHICAECFETWEECHFVTPAAAEATSEAKQILKEESHDGGPDQECSE